jgi:adenylate cyclase
VGREIERKFLVCNDGWRRAAQCRSSLRLRQGYLASDERSSIRVRVAAVPDEGGQAFLTIKSAVQGTSRQEYEYSIPVHDAEELLDTLCRWSVVEKTRHRVDYAGRTWEIDVFEGDNAGLIVAELELTAPDEAIDLPPWVGKEVTDDRRYYNAALAQKPYSAWR